MEPLTLEWKGQELVSELTDLEAATICGRIPATNKSFAFVTGLIADLRRYGSLFPNKRFWLHDHAYSQLEREKPPEAEPDAVPSNAAGHLPRIAAFLTPVSKRLKSGARVTFTSGPLTVVIKRAGENSRHPGNFYVNGLTGFGEGGNGSIYAGRISPEGHWFPTRDCEIAINALLDEFENDPAGYAMAYGQRTGNCFACNARLIDPISIGLGVGPICCRHYSIKWGKKALAAAVAMRCQRASEPTPAA